MVKFFIDFTENNEIVFKYSKENRWPGPAKNYKVQDLKSNTGSHWGLALCLRIEISRS